MSRVAEVLPFALLYPIPSCDCTRIHAFPDEHLHVSIGSGSGREYSWTCYISAGSVPTGGVAVLGTCLCSALADSVSQSSEIVVPKDTLTRHE